jgi:hypothetical protein
VNEKEQLEARVYELEQRLLAIEIVAKGARPVDDETDDEDRDVGQSDG